jgi:porin-like protein
MNSVKCLLMGSAAGLMAVSAAQAADLPVKAAPVEYVKVCNIYGAGFWYVPGTDTCMKIGTWVRYEIFTGSGDGGVIDGFGASSTASGRFTRIDTSSATSQYRALVTVDARTQTDFGTLRSYMDVGTKFQGYSTWPTSASSGLTVAGSPFNSQFNNNNVDATRAFIQFAGFTAGRIRSLYDIIAPGAYTLSNNRILSDTADAGMFAIAYTAQFSGGISLSLSLEDPGMVSPQHARSMVNMSQEYWGGGVCTTVVAGSCVGGGGGALAGGQTTDNSGGNFWDTVVNLRIDQSWGYAAVSGALHNNSGGYYNNAINSTNAAMANTVVQGHPGDSYGWAGSAGFLLTDFLGLKGDTLAFATQYGHGAVGYVIKSPGTYFLAGSGNHIAFGNTLDGVYANGTGVDMSDAFSALAAYEHFWTPKLHTAFEGGIVSVNYSGAAKSLMCAGAPGFAANPNNSLGFGYNNSTGAPSGFINGWAPGSQCNPNMGWWQAGTRTIWNPHPDLDIGVEVLYQAIQTANRGATVWQNGASGGLAPGLYTFANEGIWSAAFRIQRNFLP